MAGTYDVQIRSVPADRAAKHAVPLSQVVLQHHRVDGIQIDAQPLTGGHLLHRAVAAACSTTCTTWQQSAESG